jgi:hypothetical protein
VSSGWRRRSRGRVRSSFSLSPREEQLFSLSAWGAAFRCGRNATAAGVRCGGAVAAAPDDAHTYVQSRIYHLRSRLSTLRALNKTLVRVARVWLSNGGLTLYVSTAPYSPLCSLAPALSTLRLKTLPNVLLLFASALGLPRLRQRAAVGLEVRVRWVVLSEESLHLPGQTASACQSLERSAPTRAGLLVAPQL